MTRITLLLFAVSVASSCVPVGGTADSGIDAGTHDAAEEDAGDAGPPDDGGVDAGWALPSVVPSALDCSDLQALPEDRRCIPAGWFVMSRWHTIDQRALSTHPELAPRQPVYLDAYILDADEVSNASYLSFLDGSGRAPPPEECGSIQRVMKMEPLKEDIMEMSGWSADGRPEEGRLNHPVVCVTRSEAAAFCASKGGRLPTAGELMKVSRGPYPDSRRFPWGDTPPESCRPCLPSLSFYADYLAFNRASNALDTLPVGGRPFGSGHYDVRDINGNVSELVAECAEQLQVSYGPTSVPIVRPELIPKESCSEAVLSFGINWLTRGTPQILSSVALFSIRNEALAYYMDREFVAQPFFIGDVFGQILEPGGQAATGPGNERRSWSIGFRCAYPLPGGG